ncbi:MAG TPA: metallophosphoesterase family protein [Luteibacter sp.]|jgi:putative phosphoesterase|nr:metallophosphoesterase family protein [Luteibacter sp.]
MKIAAISDIHGNLGALDAVLEDIGQQEVDLIVNLGDILSGALQPAETADRLIALGLPTIRGNHERQVLTEDPLMMGASDLHAHRTLRPDQLAWLASLPETLAIGPDVLLVHGTPSSDLVYFLEVLTASGLRAATPAEVAALAGTTEAALILCGHTHVPRVARLTDGRTIVNPGSVGLQAYESDYPYPHRVENGDPSARYAIVTRTAEGWDVELRSVVYDWDAAADMALANGRTDWSTALRWGYMDRPA